MAPRPFDRSSMTSGGFDYGQTCETPGGFDWLDPASWPARVSAPGGRERVSGPLILSANSPFDDFIGRKLDDLTPQEWAELTRGWKVEHNHYQPQQGDYSWLEIPQWKLTSPDGDV